MHKKYQVPNHVFGIVIVVAAYLSGAATILVGTGALSERLFDLGMITLTVVAFMSIVFALSELLRRLDIVDIAWGPAFIVAAVASFIIGQQSIGLSVQSLVTLLVGLWGFRLSFSIFRRFIRHDEDKRYVELRSKWKGNLAINAYLRIFVTQAILASIISIAVVYLNTSNVDSSLGLFAWIGLAVWLVGFFFEVIGDAQLKKFLSDKKNKGKLMTKGLWKLTRHPNYFGEAAMWWGIFIIVLEVPYGWIGIITPVLITYLLYFVSGVPLTEKSFSKKPGWKEYKHQTSKFVPLPPRS